MTFKTITICVALLWALPQAKADDATRAIENRWSEIRYTMKGNREQLAALQDLRAQTQALIDQRPSNSEALLWHAMTLLLEADTHHSVASLGLAKEARDLLEAAAQNDTGVVSSMIHTALGALYNEIPGWPIGFHDDGKARAHFAKALEANRDGMDANYFYGDYLVQKHKYAEALPYLEKALAVPVRPDHERYDSGLRTEVEEALATARQKLKKD